ncbi:MAG TPA: hypothetical protein VFB22_09380 [Candidatus Baltobacteraceae bacterium]|nr:hypothetical protein [Candidatus Baltobacteraceae bacterium]
MLAALALALALAVPTYGPVPQASASPPTVLRVPTAANVAMIVNSGSTNTAGYQLTVNEDGTAALVQGDVTLKKQIPALLVRRFFDDLRAAGPVDALQAGACMKSASFGTTTRILYRGKTSPDVSCPSPSAQTRALAVDAHSLADAAGVSILPRAH